MSDHKIAVTLVAIVVSLALFHSHRLVAADADAPAKPTLIVVRGAPGEEDYEKVFAEEMKLWSQVAATSDVQPHLIGLEPPADKDNTSDKERLRTTIATAIKTDDAAPLWLIFIGHGTFDGRSAAFNLRGPDVTAVELAEWLKDCRRPLAVINTTAASAPFLTALSAPNRVIITATKSGQERNYARFGRYFAKRIIDPQADLDKDSQTSLWEAFHAAARDTADFYKSAERIPTEHPLLDDNGDTRGVRPEFFERGKLVKAIPGGAAVDGDLAKRFHLNPSRLERQLTAEQTARRDQLEASLAALRRRKSELPEPEYFAELEKLLVELARLYVREANSEK